MGDEDLPRRPQLHRHDGQPRRPRLAPPRPAAGHARGPHQRAAGGLCRRAQGRPEREGDGEGESAHGVRGDRWGYGTPQRWRGALALLPPDPLEGRFRPLFQGLMVVELRVVL